MLLIKKNQYCTTGLAVLYFLVITCILPFRLAAQNDKVFGDSIFISDGLTGKVFLLPQNTRKLPDFDTLKPLDIIYTKTINIPPRNWSSGFPGIPALFEWFGLEYAGTFKANKAGQYLFRLNSDDGSKLIIDGKLIINNDGQHGTVSKTGKVLLDDSRHSIKIQYFQGPRYQIALQLFAGLENSKEEIFPGNNFILYAQSQQPGILYWLLVLFGIILILIILLFWRKRRKEKNIGDPRQTIKKLRKLLSLTFF